MELPIVNHPDYVAKINDDNKFPIKKFGALADHLIEKGVVKNVEEGPFVMPSYVFKLTAPKNEWIKFLQHTPQPGSHDIIAMLRRKVLKFEGDLHPLMSHLLYFKLLLASLRPAESKNEN